MGTRMERAGRWLDILKFIHTQNLITGEGISIGEYTKFAGISKSPYMIGEFRSLLDADLVTVTRKPYKATYLFSYSINREVVKKHYPDIYRELTAIGWQDELL